MQRDLSSVAAARAAPIGSPCCSRRLMSGAFAMIGGAMLLGNRHLDGTKFGTFLRLDAGETDADKLEMGDIVRLGRNPLLMLPSLFIHALVLAVGQAFSMCVLLLTWVFNLRGSLSSRQQAKQEVAVFKETLATPLSAAALSAALQDARRGGAGAQILEPWQELANRLDDWDNDATSDRLKEALAAAAKAGVAVTVLKQWEVALQELQRLEDAMGSAQLDTLMEETEELWRLGELLQGSWTTRAFTMRAMEVAWSTEELGHYLEAGEEFGVSPRVLQLWAEAVRCDSREARDRACRAVGASPPDAPGMAVVSRPK